MMKHYLSVLLFTSIILTSLPAQEKFTDPRDGNMYRTITINGVTWMTENLRFIGDGAFCFENDSNNIPVYGALYEWKAAVKACPGGWRLPSGDEFRILADHFESHDLWGRGPSGAFNIQLGGQQDFQGVFSEMDEGGYYWTSTEYDQENAEYFSYLVIVNMNIADISRKDDIADIPGSEKMNRYSVRCVKD